MIGRSVQTENWNKFFLSFLKSLCILLTISSHTMLSYSTTCKRVIKFTTILFFWTRVVVTSKFYWRRIGRIVFTKTTQTFYIKYCSIQQVQCGSLYHGSCLLSKAKSFPYWAKYRPSFIVSWWPIQVYDITIMVSKKV